MSKVKKTVKVIAKALREHNINHEIVGNESTFSIAPTCSIHTTNCTIEVYKDQITVNEVPVVDIENMLLEVFAVEC